MMEAVHTSETSVNINLTTRQYNPEDSKPHTCIYFARGVEEEIPEESIAFRHA
jgi:phenolic acid decarboxylase